MSPLFFWKLWIKDYRYTWVALAILLTLSIGYLWFAYAKGPDNVMHWDKLQEQKIIETTVHSFRLGPLSLDVPADSYVILEHLNGSDLKPNITAYYIFLVVLVISAIVLITVISSLDGFWFFAGMTAVILFLIGMRFEVLGIMGRYDQVVPSVILGCYLLLAFYFNRFRPSTTFPIRLASFALLTAMVAIVITFLSVVENPMAYLAVTGYVPALVLSLLFIIMTAHEVFAFLIKAAGQGSSKNLRHVAIICFVYFLNLLITALHEVGTIQWDFVYINAYFLLTLAAVIGIWGYKDREVLYENIFPFYPLGAFFFLALGAICLITTGQLVANDNDPAIRVIRHTIIYSHTGYGLIFMIYVIANFIQTLGENRSIAEHLYRPQRMPYFTYRLAGTITMLAFFFVSFWQGYVSDATAAFYNMSGDLHAMENDPEYAEGLYKKSKSQSVLNHRANYSLANAAMSQFRFRDAQDFYESANLKRPTSYSILNYANTYLWELEYKEAIRAYRRILASKEQVDAAAVNLGYAYIKYGGVDSALFYLSDAREISLTKTTAELNFLALAATKVLPIDTDSTLKIFDTDDAGVKANSLALGSLLGQRVNVVSDPLVKQPMSLQEATLLNNYIIHNATTLDTTFTRDAFAIASDSLNADFSEALKASLAYAFYHQGNVRKALEILAELVYRSQAYQGKFNYIMGLWALEQQTPELAAEYFDYANFYNYKNGRLYYAIALTEARRTSEALVAWDSILVAGDLSAQRIATNMRRILTLRSDQLAGLSDSDLYQFNRYRVTNDDSVTTERLLNGFTNANYKAQALLDVSKRLFDEGKVVKAIRYYQRIAGLSLTDSNLYNNVRHFELEMLASRGELRSLATQINKDIHFGPTRFLQKVWYTALLSEQSGDLATATRNYDILASYNPFFVEGLEAAAAFYRKKDAKSLKPYNILAEAVQVNKRSLKLLRAYHAEAIRMGFDEFAATAAETIVEIESAKDY
ncbi:tetratricopeptide repeat protein [Pseudochryseolinea flava]|uniref:Tetratricopeptide repeat protein n=1 Tax=Pseudochryseolinea flava TaxID=2059302 RepID=A0A364XUF3_9BACT|nr:hypothetical protein [Pseudochryseolinea flava]RAV97773.1 hypothetical protein DQQ10_26745 [Pseudochryseolinea flava]